MPPGTTILKVAHHGSKTSMDPLFLERSAPLWHDLLWRKSVRPASPGYLTIWQRRERLSIALRKTGLSDCLLMGILIPFTRIGHKEAGH